MLVGYIPKLIGDATMIEASLKDVVPTTQLRTEMPDWTPGTCELYAKTLPGFPKPIRVSGINFYRRDEVRAWVKDYKSRKRTRRNVRA
jgi:hypothetical protein